MSIPCAPAEPTAVAIEAVVEDHPVGNGSAKIEGSNDGVDLGVLSPHAAPPVNEVNGRGIAVWDEMLLLSWVIAAAVDDEVMLEHLPTSVLLTGDKNSPKSFATRDN